MNGTAAAIAILRDAYPRQDFPDRSVALYGAELADLDDAVVLRAVRRLIRRRTWLPSIAEIRLEAAEETLPLPTPEQAWEAARQGSGGRWPTVLRDAVQDVGGPWALRTSTKPEIIHAQFLKAYAARREHALATEAGAAAPETRRFAALPPTTRIRERPVMTRLGTRLAGRTPGPPTEDEKRDAILVLKDGPNEDLLYVEAERILADSDPGTVE